MEEKAKRRVKTTTALAAHAETILYPWSEGNEHWKWVATAPVQEIVEWAENVEAGAR